MRPDVGSIDLGPIDVRSSRHPVKEDGVDLDKRRQSAEKQKSTKDSEKKEKKKKNLDRQSLKRTLEQAQPLMAKRLKVGAASRDSGTSDPRPPTGAESAPPHPPVERRRKGEREREQKTQQQPQEEQQLQPKRGEVGQPSAGPQLEEQLEQDRRQEPQEPQELQQQRGQQLEEPLEPPPHSPPQPVPPAPQEPENQEEGSRGRTIGLSTYVWVFGHIALVSDAAALSKPNSNALLGGERAGRVTSCRRVILVALSRHAHGSGMWGC
ncbi:putative uncharacterized protein DDB_G0294196 [Sorghum bicolor]|uniref:putative uncharacterized protein DDB_G0294196 n=1 Tax=Sorghum bicolor TaxID=4558 RepID=UPI000B4256AB|nr:putative uncharacterized protein DDB_G0294196 [Sorghum bicolor]|eukprot:XP_021306893.1 putative uncharacterized protein DDB_G0294196 [Sorghum bicolor]